MCAAALVVRFRRARGLERQQLKWLALAAILFALLTGTIAVVRVIDPSDSAPLYVALAFGVGPLVYAAFPIAAGIAILRHRLFDIDLLINRTLVYGALTAGLGIVYWGGVVLFQQLLRPFTEGSDIAIVASTLLVAALFQPARSVIQEAVDRRFYRARYDAQRTLAAFSSHVRDEVNLEPLTRELLAVAERTMQPAAISLWLPRSSSRSASRDARGNDSGTLAR
jgi:hypothetical protein